MLHSSTYLTRRLICLAVLSILCFELSGQEVTDSLALRKRDLPFILDYRPLQVSIWPALGANAGEGSHYANELSVSLLYGLSAANFVFMYATLVNRNLYYASGLQVAGLMNKVRRADYGLQTKRYESYEEVEKVEGVQVTGGVNSVGKKLVGTQIAGVYNNVLRDIRGIQFAGMGNRTGRYMSGGQVSGLINIGIRSAHGFQWSVGLNYTQGDLKGLQMGVINTNRRMKTAAGTKRKLSSVQVGVFNRTEVLEGYQVGLVNFTKKFYGNQIGLINLYQRAPYRGSSSDTYGRAFGLINLGTGGGLLSFYTDESLLLASELTTGNCINCKWSSSGMPIQERFLTFIHNALIYQVDLNDFDPVVRWKLGYGIDWVHFNKHSLIPADPKNKRYQLRVGARLLRLFYDAGIGGSPSFESKIKFEAGYRILSSYVYVGTAFNARWSSGPLMINETILAASALQGKLQLWPGLQLGVRL